MMVVRQWHTYLGALIAPSVLFFAFTGALQLFHFHEAHGVYTPPPILEKLGAVHKDQKFEADEHPHGGKVKPDEPEAPAITALKFVFLAVAAGLIVSTLLGLWMALTTARRRGMVLILLLVGAAAPVLILLL